MYLLYVFQYFPTKDNLYFVEQYTLFLTLSKRSLIASDDFIVPGTIFLKLYGGIICMSRSFTLVPILRLKKIFQGIQINQMKLLFRETTF